MGRETRVVDGEDAEGGESGAAKEVAKAVVKAVVKAAASAMPAAAKVMRAEVHAAGAEG